VNPKSLANLKPFKPGQSGNPLGRQTILPPEIRKARKANQVVLIQLITKLFLMSDAQASKEIENPDISQLHHAVQAMIGKARGGEVTAFRYMIDLMVGKVPEHDYDGFSEEDLRILNRVKEVIGAQPHADGDDRASH
jgi:hypothetical protein